MFSMVNLTKAIFIKMSYILCSDDSGVTIGAGLLAYYRFAKNLKRIVKEVKSNFFGPEFSEKEIKIPSITLK